LTVYEDQNGPPYSSYTTKPDRFWNKNNTGKPITTNGGKHMHYLKIGDDKYCSDELAGLVSSGLSLLGLDSYQTIRVSTRDNRISIGFKALEDANAARSIAGIPTHTRNKTFRSRDVSQFVLDLYSVATTSNINVA
jgi:hypothetical protein